VNYYLNRYSFREELITEIPKDDLGIVVVIPCCNEPDLTASLQSLYTCDEPICNVEVIVVINASERAEETVLVQNRKSLIEAEGWKKSHFDKFTFHFIIENELPKNMQVLGWHVKLVWMKQ